MGKTLPVRYSILGLEGTKNQEVLWTHLKVQNEQTRLNKTRVQVEKDFNQVEEGKKYFLNYLQKQRLFKDYFKAWQTFSYLPGKPCFTLSHYYLNNVNSIIKTL